MERQGLQGFTLYLMAVWFSYLIAKPLYLFPKGLPQISDVVLACGMIPAAVVMFMDLRGRISKVALAGGLFAALTLAINLVNYAFIADAKFLLSSLYYPYNFLIFLFTVYLFKRDTALMVRVSVAGIVMSLIVQSVSLALFPEMGRATGGFKNPNQLSYWAFLSAACLVFLRRERTFGVVEFAVIGMAAALQTFALSKAGILAFGVFGLVLVFMPQVPRMAKIVIAFLVLFGGSYFYFSGAQDYGGAAERVVSRLETIGQEGDDSLEGRGYDRLMQAPGYMILGAGEGGFERFKNWGGPNELHSGLATILFSYGIVGFGLFAAFLFFIFQKQPKIYAAVLVTVLLFSVTSQTIRFTHTWVFLGIAYGSYLAMRREEGEERAVLPGGQMMQPV